jgi:hypothetical protein
MKFTDTFFRFPERIYKNTDIEKAQGLDWSGDAIPFLISKAKIASIEDIESYEEFYSIGRSIEDIRHAGSEGFDCCILQTKGKEYICHWNLQKLEDEINKFADKLDTANLDAENGLIDRIVERMQEKGITVIDKDQIHLNS